MMAVDEARDVRLKAPKEGAKDEKSEGTKPAGVGKRIPHPKVRSGCLTCKKRRVKCDERRPYCIRCEKFGVTCDGYIRGAPTMKEATKPIKRPLMPRKRPGASGGPTNEVKKLRFGNLEEMRYFRLFCEKTSFHLSGFYDPILWGRIVLQASEAEDSIRHAVISIGALDMTSAMLRDMESANAQEHHLFALKQYSKAISDMRAMVQRQDEMHDLHTALVASVLIICFETYHGNYSSAAQQIRTGVRLIEDSKRRKGSAGVEEELVRAFDRLDVQSMSHSDPFTFQEHAELKDVYTHRNEDLPPVFLDLKTSRDYFNFISRRVCHFASMAWKLEHMSTDKPSHSFWDPTGDMSWRETLLQEHGMFTRLSEQWMISFTQIYNNAREDVKTNPAPYAKSTLAPLAMRNHFLSMRLALRHFQDVDEVAWDRSMPEFVEMLENAETMVANSEGAVFSFDLQSVWPLDVIAKKCRVSKMRWRAIHLLKSRPRREGIWDSIVAALVCEWVVNVEEEGMLEDGTIPESSRVRNIGVELDFENRKARVWCFLPPQATSESEKETAQPRKREALLEWGRQKWNADFGESGRSGSGYQRILSGRSNLCEDAGATGPVWMGVYFNARKASTEVDHHAMLSVFSTRELTQPVGYNTINPPSDAPSP
ncbi:uncharacterized protein PAC_13055 [Phialocephala subalpina]|uniref:Zn(2)-C6 fungal-type domain-containing protein n=1 Tax=Phialocephala subalpina TaxID=576137 RepID=A0A1L7XDS1_9HELO|nr:uncharacterized protein PAC_13055 [Phialocephala subalpina]